jgi:hypothetical protein
MAIERLQSGNRWAGCSVIVMALLLLSLAASPSWGQQQSHTQAKAPGEKASIDLDLLSLLQSEMVFPAEAEDGIWTFKAGAGRKLVQLPFMISAGKQDTEFNSTIVRVRGARFLAWRTLDPEFQKAEAGSDAARDIEASLVDMPTLTRLFTLTSNGRARWKMDRVMLQGELKTIDLAAGVPQRLYPLRISPQILSAAMPPAPKLMREQGENPMDFYARSAVANNEYRVARERYMQLREQVAALPDTFDEKAPSRTWGLFDIMLFERNLEITGTDEETWRINQDILNTLRAASRAVLLPESKIDTTHVAAMMTVAQDPHPYSQRLVAYTLALSGATQTATVNDQLYQLLNRMLQGTDGQAKRIVIKEIASVFPPTQASLSLLKNVAKSDLDPRASLDALRGMMAIDFSQPTQETRDTLAKIQKDLNDPNGPTPTEILDEVLNNTRDKSIHDVSTLAAGIRFAEIPEDRQIEAIIHVVEKAGTHNLAAHWLDQQLLGSFDTKMVQRTLEIIANADAGKQNLTPAISTGISRLFGGGKAASGEGQPSAGKGRVAHISSPIMVLTVNHGIFRALRSTDPKIRQLAWQALPNFIFTPVDVSQLAEGVDPRIHTGRYETLMEIALQQNPTPVGAANFLLHQPQRADAAAAMVQLVLRGTSEASAAASRHLLAMKTSVEPILLGLSFGERAALASRLYENTIGPAPLAVNLLRQRNANNPLVVWFAQQIALGQLPTREQWGSFIANEAGLLELVTSSDPEVGTAAVAALVYRVGGTDRDVPPLARTMRNLPDQSIANLTSEWQRAKRNLLMAQFQEIIGPYQLILKVDGAEHPLGTVQFMCDGQNISFVNQDINLSVPEDRLGIRIDSPVQLKSFSQLPQLTSLPLDEVSSIELSVQPNGEWSGPITIPNSQSTPTLIMRSMFGN